MGIVDDFLVLCRDAEEFVKKIKEKKPEALKLQGKKPLTLKVTAIHYLARKRGLNLTLHKLYRMYDITPQTIMETEKIFKKLDEESF